MSMIAVCDGCGKQAPAVSNGFHWFKPNSWYERTPAGEKRPITACSRECIDAVETKRKEEGKQSSTVILPI
jgi:hypothetical protein